MKHVLTACYSSQQSIAQQKNQIALEDHLFSSNPILRTAHILAHEIIVTLLFIMLSPHAHPCERMRALYLINRLHLPGTHGLALQRYRDRANRFYFTYDGILREYDPSRVSAQSPKHIKAVIRFLHAISMSKVHYNRLLSMGISYGISSLAPYQKHAIQELWQQPVPSFMWRYAAQIFKEVTTLDVIEMRTVTPEKIFAHQVNHDFMALMHHCTPPIHHKEAQEFLAKHAQAYRPADPMHTIMERYYQESCKRTS